MVYLYPFTKFDLAQDVETYEDENGKILKPIIIGEDRIKGQQPEPIIEYIYPEVISSALQGSLKVALFEGLCPPVLFYGQEGISVHNDSISQFMDDINAALKEIPYSLKIDAMKEYAVLHLDKAPSVQMTIRRNSVLHTLVDLVNGKTGVKFNQFLIVELLRNEMKEREEKNAVLEGELRSLKKDDLISLFGDCKEYKETGATRSDRLNQLIASYGPEKAISGITWEFTERCFNR